MWSHLMTAAMLAVAGGQQGRSGTYIVDTVAADSVAVERAAALYTAEHLLTRPRADTVSTKRVAFDARPADGQVRSLDQSTALAKLLGADIVPRDSVIVCKQGCRMVGYSVLVRLQLRQLTDTLADVAVTMEYPSRFTRVPISLDEPTLRFEKRNGAWQFVGTPRARST